jgi:hypothetical protein
MSNRDALDRAEKVYNDAFEAYSEAVERMDDPEVVAELALELELAQNECDRLGNDYIDNMCDDDWWGD